MSSTTPRHNSIVRKFRSIKSLRSESVSQQLQISHPHLRKASEASTLSTASADSGARSPTSRTIHSSSSSASSTLAPGDFDGLRMHPPWESGASSPAFDPTPNAGRRATHPVMSRQQRQQYHRVHSYRALEGGSSSEIYEGFDFGFDKQKAQRQQKTGGSDESSEEEETDGLLSSGYPSPMTTSSSEFDSMPTTPLSSPSRRNTHWAVTPRPQPAGVDEPDYFMKRGGWKRRGIVFGGAEDEGVTSEDAFDLP